MDSLGGGHDVQDEDLSEFKFSVEGLSSAKDKNHWTGDWWTLDSRSKLWDEHREQLKIQVNQDPDDWIGPNQVWGSRKDDSLEKWTEWLERQAILGDTPTKSLEGSFEEDRITIVVASLMNRTGRIPHHVHDQPIALRYVSLKRAVLEQINRKLHIHRGFYSAIHDGSTCITRLNGEASGNGRPCEVYVLRTSNNVSFQTAITITHFPAIKGVGTRTNALIFGYEQEDLQAFTRILTSFGNLPISPARIMACFLEVEKENRFTAVRQSLRDMQQVLYSLSTEPVTGNPTSLTARHNLSKTTDFFSVSHLRLDGLVSWRDQLALLKTRLASKDGRGNEEIEIQGYLEQLIARYDHRIGRCDIVLQGLSLALQIEDTQRSRNDTEIAIGDGKTMKAVAVLTMVFLPGTFIATMLSVPQIADALKPENNRSFGDTKWLWYVVLTMPITVATILAYAAWELLYKKKHLRSFFGGRRRRGSRNMDLELGEMQ